MYFKCFAAEKPAVVHVPSLKSELPSQVMGSDKCQRQLTHVLKFFGSCFRVFSVGIQPGIGKIDETSSFVGFYGFKTNKPWF